MSPSLSIETQWIDQPSAANELERRTWADLRIYAANRAVTRVWDRESHAERESIFIPALPLARWVLKSWWALLYEPCRGELVPGAEMSRQPEHRGWLGRHCLRAADSGLLLPRAYLYSDGRGVCVRWEADEPGSHPRMPAEFITGDVIHLGHDEAADGLRRFVGDVVRRLDSDADPQAVQLRDDWAAIATADAEESAFCRAAGRLGLDPYRTDDWDPSLVDLLEVGLDSDTDRPMVADLLESIDLSRGVDAAEVAQTWMWADQVRESHDLRESPGGQATPLDTGRPASSGHRLAKQVRQSMAHTTSGPLPRVADAAEVLGLGSLKFIPRNHLPGRGVKAAVGWSGGKEPVVVGPASRSESGRFLEARGLYHAAFACRTSPRLVTAAHTWDQQVSRAFAAELLAPQAELVARAEEWAGDDDADLFLHRLADEYKVSVWIIRHQLDNAGVRFEEAA